MTKKLYIKAFVSKLKLSPNLQQNVIKIFQNKNKENTNYFKIIVINFFYKPFTDNKKYVIKRNFQN